MLVENCRRQRDDRRKSGCRSWRAAALAGGANGAMREARRAGPGAAWRQVGRGAACSTPSSVRKRMFRKPSSYSFCEPLTSRAIRRSRRLARRWR